MESSLTEKDPCVVVDHRLVGGLEHVIFKEKQRWVCSALREDEGRGDLTAVEEAVEPGCSWRCMTVGWGAVDTSWLATRKVFVLFVFSLYTSQTLKEGSSECAECPSTEMLELGWTRTRPMTSNSACTGWHVKILANLNCPVTLWLLKEQALLLQKWVVKIMLRRTQVK